MNTQKSVRNISFKGYGIVLRPVNYNDIMILRNWRNNPNVRNNLVNKSLITEKQQKSWYRKIKERTDQAHWVVWYKGMRAGYVTIKGKGPLELQNELTGGMFSGFPKVKHKLLGYAMQMIMLDIAFEHLSISKFHGPVNKNNSNVRKLLKQLGFRENSYKGDFVWTIVNPVDFLSAKKKFKRYFLNSDFQLIK